jgi:uncharacterized membrane protein
MSARRWLIIGLTASVALNLLLVGFLIGRVSGMPRPVAFQANTQASIGWMMRNLPEERREVLRDDAREHFRGVRPELRALREAQKRLFAILSADELDQDALNDVLAELRTRSDAIQAANLALLEHLAGKVTPEERRMLAEGLTRHPEPPKRRPHRPPTDAQ